MNKIFVATATACILFFAGFTSAYSQDGFFSDAQTLRQGTASLGVQPAIYTDLDNGIDALPASGLWGKPGP